MNKSKEKKKINKDKVKSPEKVSLLMVVPLSRVYKLPPQLDQPRLSDKEHRLRQGLPPDLPRRPTDIYITPELSDQQCVRITSLLEQGRKVWIHGLGSSIPLVITIINSLRLDS